MFFNMKVRFVKEKTGMVLSGLRKCQIVYERNLTIFVGYWIYIDGFL